MADTRQVRDSLKSALTSMHHGTEDPQKRYKKWKEARDKAEQDRWKEERGSARI